jgi:hypothetical protein
VPTTLYRRTLNVVELVPVPLGVVTLILPLLAPGGTVSLILVGCPC